jgi:hypothetical protein
MTREGTSTRIRSLKPNVTREEAIRYFSEGAMNRIADMIRGPVGSLAELYIPFRLFHVTIVSAGRVQVQTLALDAARGVLDLYQFPAPNDEEKYLWLETRNVLPGVLDNSQSLDQIRYRLLEKLRRMIYTRGFFRVRGLRIVAEPIPGEICVPYWVCFRGLNERVHLAVLDAVRRRPEGAKVRRLVEEWLRSDAGLSRAC